MQTAHDFKSKPRTADVQVQDTVEFSSLMLSDEVLAGLTQSGFQCPSPIQLKAIPLGRCGLDLIVQAKSGTGKTCVFAVIALESVLLEYPGVQVLVLAPTREIAVQIWEVLKSIGGCMKKLCCHTFIGGMPKSEDQQKLRKCHIAIGTPGRVKQLIEEKLLLTDSIRLFVLDEADKLMEDSFQDQVNWVYSSLPENKQMLALSATYPEVLAQHLTIYMRNPTFVRLSITDPALLGIRQYQKVVPFRPLTHQQFEEKCKHLVQLLSSVNFDQCLVFSNYQLRAEGLSTMLNKKGWPARYISGSLDQTDRLQAMAALKQFHCRVLISTDVTSRGIDAENVNLVVNLDVPFDHETYLHRVGRAGRFGSYGAAVSFVAQGKEKRQLQEVETACNTCIKPLPDPVPADLTRKSGYVNVDSMVTTEVLVTRTTDDTKDTEASIRKTPKDTRRTKKGKAARIIKENQEQRGKKNKEMSAKLNDFAETENDTCLPEKGTVTEKLHDKSCPVGKIKLNGEVAEEVKDGVMADSILKRTTSSEISVNQIHKSKNAVVTDNYKGDLETRDKEPSGPEPTGSVDALHKVGKINTERMSLLQKNKSKSERTNLGRMNPALTVDKCVPFNKVWCKRVPKYKTFQHAFSDCQKYLSDNSESGNSALSLSVSRPKSQWSPSAKLLNQIRTVISTQPLPQSLGKSDEVVMGESASSSGSSTSTCSDSECSYSLGSVEDGDVIKEVDEEEYDEEEEDASEARGDEQVQPQAVELHHPEEEAQTLLNGSTEANKHYLSEREKDSLQRIQRYAAHAAKENLSSSSISEKYLQKDDLYSRTESTAVKESQTTARDSITASDHEKESHDSSLISSLSSPSDHSDTLSDSSQSDGVHENHAPFVHDYNQYDDDDVENQTYDHGEYEITGAASHKTVPEYYGSYNEYYNDSGAQQYSGTTHRQGGERQNGYYGHSSYSNVYFDNGYYGNDEQENMHYGEHYDTGYHGNATFYRSENYAVEDQFTPWQWGSQNQRQGFSNTHQQPPEQSLDAFRNPTSWHNYWSQVYQAGFMGGMTHVTSYMQGYYDRCIQERFTPTAWWSAHSSAQANYIKYMTKAFRKLQLRRTVDHKDKTK